MTTIWDWMLDMIDEKHAENVRKWREDNSERNKEIDRRAGKKYYEKKKEEDPEFVERRKRENAERMKKAYKPSAELTPEELEARRARTRELVRRHRERKKAEKLAAEQTKQNGAVALRN